MKQKMITAALVQLIIVLIGSDLVKQIFELVQALVMDDIPGVDKKQRVTAELNDVKNEFYEVVQGMASWAVSAAIDIAYAYVAARQ